MVTCVHTSLVRISQRDTSNNGGPGDTILSCALKSESWKHLMNGRNESH